MIGARSTQGGSPMGSRYLYLVRMDVAHDHETTFNEVYDTEHAPALTAVPGVRRGSRYRNPSATDPRYIAAYEIESPEILQSAAWKTAGELGWWATDIRPHTMNRHLTMYEWVGGSATDPRHAVHLLGDDGCEPHREALFRRALRQGAPPSCSSCPAPSTSSATARRSRRAPLSGRVYGRGADRPSDVARVERHLRSSAGGSPRCARTPTTSATS
jgi:hypothetical protein